ncbi:hypothetical protein QH494_16125 [Sphingomonas sp. AR_OL41]|uniref:hypothetical protein n=1 Tax=Sphingomonas sp. AR_OL41 TaxID=3042729 RepID=UPI0024816653|nr:hypothetical protein [Sphingomonas sp. AR_OL41]MDH7973720.1 hypothetical protein [Sphingomonas sp. AR_OL41]
MTTLFERMSTPRSTIAAKVDYVLGEARATDTGGHHCHWPGCDAQVPPAMWGCKRHWYMLPAELRRKIWRTFKPGQEKSKTPSPAYIEAAREVRAWIDAQTAAPDAQERLL